MNRQFPALSGLAMLLIVINHTISMGTGVPSQYGFDPVGSWVKILLSVIQGFGIFAVPTFLFISGTFITYAAKGDPPRLTGRFLGRSIGHILWPYLIWSLVFYAVVFLQFNESYSGPGYVKNLLVGYPYHFIPLLLLFYVLSPILVRLGRRYGLLMIAALGIYQCFLLVLFSMRAGQGVWSLLIPPGLGRTLADWAVFFPLGVVYGLNTRTWVPRLQKSRGLLVFLTVLFFVLGGLHFQKVIGLPVAASLSAFTFVLLLPVIDRGSIPMVKRLEEIGKRSYGLYLTHLIVLDLVLLAIGAGFPWLFNFQVLLLVPLFLIALTVPLSLMRALSRSRAKVIYRYLLG